MKQLKLHEPLEPLPASTIGKCLCLSLTLHFVEVPTSMVSRLGQLLGLPATWLLHLTGELTARLLSFLPDDVLM